MASATVNDAHKKSAKSYSIDLDTLCDRAPYVTDLSGFLKEGNEAQALAFWLREYEQLAHLKTVEDVYCAVERSIADLDQLINEQLNEIIHHPRLQKLEASWRGLWYLVIQAEGVRNCKIKVLDITWHEIVRDFDRALDFDQSQMFQKIYSDEFGTPGGEPFGVLIGDYSLSHRPSKRHPHDDVAALRGMSAVAAAAFAPFIAAASSELFGIDDFSTLGSPLKLTEVFNQEEYLKWRALRDTTDARFVGLTVPRILMRKPYRSTPGSYKGLFFYEKKYRKGRDSYLWGNAAYAFGAILIREFASVGWFGHIRGVPRDQVGGGLLTNLPVDSFATDAEGIAVKPVTDVLITDTTERELSNLGFVPLCKCYDTPFAAFYSNQSIQQPKYQNSHSQFDSVNAKLASMLQHVLCGSRMAHYIKVMIRDKVGSFMNAEECENLLRQWLNKYISGREDLAWEEQARYPLRSASVEVKEHPERPGQFMCAIRMVPHYQIDQMVSELELVTELRQGK